MTVKSIMASTVWLFLFLFSVAFVSGKDLRVDLDDDVRATCGYDVRLVTHFSSIFFSLRSPTSRKCVFLPQTGPKHDYALLKLQALVYDIFPSTTAVFSYAIGSRKLSANEQFFVGAQTVVSLLQTTQIISDVCLITHHVAYASSNQTKIV